MLFMVPPTCNLHAWDAISSEDCSGDESSQASQSRKTIKTIRDYLRQTRATGTPLDHCRTCEIQTIKPPNHLFNIIPICFKDHQPPVKERRSSHATTRKDVVAKWCNLKVVLRMWVVFGFFTCVCVYVPVCCSQLATEVVQQTHKNI